MNKIIKNLLKTTVYLYLIVASVEAKELDVEFGMWEWLSSMEMSGMVIPMPPYSSCLSKSDLIPNRGDALKDCKIIENNVNKNKVSWKIECKTQAGKSLSIGNMSYNKTTAKGEIKIITEAMTIISKITGRRTGKCK